MAKLEKLRERQSFPRSAFEARRIFSCATEIALQVATASHHLRGLFPPRLLTTESQWRSDVCCQRSSSRREIHLKTDEQTAKKLQGNSAKHIFLTVAAFPMIKESFHKNNQRNIMYYFSNLRNSFVSPNISSAYLQTIKKKNCICSCSLNAFPPSGRGLFKVFSLFFATMMITTQDSELCLLCSNAAGFWKINERGIRGRDTLGVTSRVKQGAGFFSHRSVGWVSTESLDQKFPVCPVRDRDKTQ